MKESKLGMARNYRVLGEVVSHLPMFNFESGLEEGLKSLGVDFDAAESANCLASFKGRLLFTIPTLEMRLVEVIPIGKPKKVPVHLLPLSEEGRQSYDFYAPDDADALTVINTKIDFGSYVSLIQYWKIKED